MNSRERVMQALDVREPDRVPIVLGGTGSSIHVWAQRSLKTYLGLEGGDELLYDQMQLLAHVDPRIEERYCADIAPIFPSPIISVSMVISQSQLLVYSIKRITFLNQESIMNRPRLMHSLTCPPPLVVPLINLAHKHPPIGLFVHQMQELG